MTAPDSPSHDHDDLSTASDAAHNDATSVSTNVPSADIAINDTHSHQHDYDLTHVLSARSGHDVEIAAVMSRLTDASGTGPAYSIFTPRQRNILVYIASWSASFSALSAQIYFPAITNVASSLGVTPEKVNLSVTVYMIFQGLAPSFWGPLSDRKGRRIVILATFTVYIGACLGLALTKTYAQLLVLRALQSTGSSSTIAIGAGILGDITTRENRGGYMGVFQAALNLPLALGPVVGGAMAETVGWRAIFWLLFAYSSAFVVFSAIFLPETLRAIVGNGSIVPPSIFNRCPVYSLWVPKELQCRPDEKPENVDEKAQVGAPATAPPKPYRIIDIFRPVCLLGKRDVFLSVAFLSLHYTMWQMAVTAMSTLFGTVYGLNVLDIGLTFISNGVGCMVGTIVLGRLLDRDYAKMKAKAAATKTPLSTARARLRTAWIYSLGQVCTTVVFGWTVDKRVHIAVPIICMFFMTVSAVSIQASVNTFLVDNFPKEGASVTATLNLARCLLGAGGTVAVLPLSNAIGVGWAFTMLALILVLSNGLLIVLLFAQEGASLKSLPGALQRRAKI